MFQAGRRQPQPRPARRRRQRQRSGRITSGPRRLSNCAASTSAMNASARRRSPRRVPEDWTYVAVMAGDFVGGSCSCGSTSSAWRAASQTSAWACAGARVALIVRCRRWFEPVERLRRHRVADRHQGVERDQRAVRGAHLERGDVRRAGARPVGNPDHHVVLLAIALELGDVLAAQQHLERPADLRRGDAEIRRLLAVDRDRQLRLVQLQVALDVLQPLVLPGPAGQRRYAARVRCASYGSVAGLDDETAPASLPRVLGSQAVAD